MEVNENEVVVEIGSISILANVPKGEPITDDVIHSVEEQVVSCFRELGPVRMLAVSSRLGCIIVTITFGLAVPIAGGVALLAILKDYKSYFDSIELIASQIKSVRMRIGGKEQVKSAHYYASTLKKKASDREQIEKAVDEALAQMKSRKGRGE